jgi:hypothetical protein
MKNLLTILLIFFSANIFAQKFTSSCECTGLYVIKNTNFKLCSVDLNPYQTLFIDGSFDDFIIIKNIISSNSNIVQQKDGINSSIINQRKYVGEYIENGNGYITIYFYKSIKIN